MPYAHIKINLVDSDIGDKYVVECQFFSCESFTLCRRKMQFNERFNILITYKATLVLDYKLFKNIF